MDGHPTRVGPGRRGDFGRGAAGAGCIFPLRASAGGLASVMTMSVTVDRPTAFTSIPEVDLSRWHGGAAARAALANGGRRGRPRGRLLPARRPRRPRRVPDPLLRPPAGAFFELPEEVKATIDKRRSRHFRGWERVGAELTDNRTDYREQLDVSSEHPARARRRRARRTSASTGPTSGCPRTCCPGFRAAGRRALRPPRRRRRGGHGRAVRRARARPPTTSTASSASAGCRSSS